MTLQMKLLILAIIVLIIPTFFTFVFVMSTISRLANLRNRCRAIRQRIDAGAGKAALPTGAEPNPANDVQARRDFHLAAEQYNAARTRFPASLIAALSGFREMERLPDRP